MLSQDLLSLGQNGYELSSSYILTILLREVLLLCPTQGVSVIWLGHCSQKSATFVNSLAAMKRTEL